MEAMKSGLGAISSGMGTPSGTPRRPESKMGMPRQSMEQMVQAAREMSDGQLADILAGRSMEVPQFVAMSEAMGRKQLRTAMEGAQARQAQQAQQPSLRERFLAETQAQSAPQPQQPAPRPQASMPQEAGIDALPAPNMAQMDSMANGGIVAFADEGLVQSPYSDELERQAAEDRGMLMRGLKTVGAEVGDRMMLPLQALGSTGALFNRGLRAIGVPSSMAPTIPTDYTLEGASLGFGGGPMATALEEQRAAQEAQDQRQAADVAAMADLGLTPEGKMAPPETPAPDMDALEEAVSRGGAGGAGMGGAGAGAGADMAQMPARSRFEQFAGRDEELQRTLDEQQRQSQGEFLMQIGASLLTSPTIAQGIGEGAQKALPGLAANRQAAAKLQRDAREFQFNVAKAEEAAEMGDRELALRHEQLAIDRAYKTGLLAVKGSTSGLTRKDMAKMYMDFRENKLKPAGAALRYDGMSDAKKQEWEQETRAEFAQLMGSLGVGVGGSGMMQTMPASVQAAIDAEFNKRFGSE